MNFLAQFFLYDVLIGFVLLFIVAMILRHFIKQKKDMETKLHNFNTPTMTLDKLCDTPFENEESLLYYLSYALNQNNTTKTNKAIKEINSIISTENTDYEYKFSDITKDEIILIDTRTNFTEKVLSAKKTRNKHVFELKYYNK